jgi:hypothetical protein
MDPNAPSSNNNLDDVSIDDVKNGSFEPSQSIEELTEEYFQAKQDLRESNKQLRELKDEHPEADELKKLSDQARQIRKRMKMEEDIGMLHENSKKLRERKKMLKELIKIKLQTKGVDEVVRGQKKLKVTAVLKEMKNEEPLDFEDN